MGLKHTDTDVIKAALESFIQNKPDGYKPSPGEYADHCKRFKSSVNITKVIENDEEYKHRESVKLIERNKHEISRRVEKKQEIAKKDPNLNIYEHCDMNAESVCYSCYGHIDPEHFKGQVHHAYQVIPSRIYHTWIRSKKIHTRDSNNNIIASNSTFEFCECAKPGANEMTYGYLNPGF